MSMTQARAAGPNLLRRVFGTFPTGVAAVAALAEGRPVGIAVSSFTSVSLEPAMVLVCVAHSSTTWPTWRTWRDRLRPFRQRNAGHAFHQRAESSPGA